MKKYSTKKECIKSLEQMRWVNGIKCSCCKSKKISNKAEKLQMDRYQCQKCKKIFTVTVGTIFYKAKILPEWFMILDLMLNSKKSLSSYQISRDIGISQPTVWEIMTKIRKPMQTGESELLKGIVEMDKIYIDGNPNKNEYNKRGKGTNKTSVVGMTERNVKVKTEVVNKSNKLSFSTLAGILKRNVDIIKISLMTDGYKRILTNENHN